MEQAQIFLPTTTVYEKAASHYFNQEGRVQQATPLHLGGTPISQLGPSHPPREYRAVIPGGDPLPAGLILATLTRILAFPENPGEVDLWEFLAQGNEVFSNLKNLPAAEIVPGVRILPRGSKAEGFTGQWQEEPQKSSGRSGGTPVSRSNLRHGRIGRLFRFYSEGGEAAFHYSAGEMSPRNGG